MRLTDVTTATRLERDTSGSVLAKLQTSTQIHARVFRSNLLKSKQLLRSGRLGLGARFMRQGVLRSDNSPGVECATAPVAQPLR